MKAFNYLLIFLGACICFTVYNELILLPYQTAKDYSTAYEMSFRDPNINVGVVLGSYVLMCTGSYAYVSYMEELKVMDRKRSLTHEKGEVVKVTQKMYGNSKGEM